MLTTYRSSGWVSPRKFIKAYNPAEPRVPAGSAAGGQWTVGHATGPRFDAESVGHGQTIKRTYDELPEAHRQLLNETGVLTSIKVGQPTTIARGVAGGEEAAAHYSMSDREIVIGSSTRDVAGSMTHEVGHAIDVALAKKSGVGVFASESTKAGRRLHDAFSGESRDLEAAHKLPGHFAYFRESRREAFAEVYRIAHNHTISDLLGLTDVGKWFPSSTRLLRQMLREGGVG